MTNVNAIEAGGVKLAGKFVAEVYNIFSKRSYTVDQDNMILDAFFFTWLGGTTANSQGFFDHCGLGTGTSAITAADTSITPTADARVPYSLTEACVKLADGQWRTGRGYVFPVRSTPQTVNKIGIYSELTGGILSAATLLSSPLNLIAGDILTVKHYITATLDLADRTGLVVFESNNYPYTLRWWNTAPTFEGGLFHGSPWNLTGDSYNVTGNSMGYSTLSDFLQNQTLHTNTSGYPDIPLTTGDARGSTNAAITITADPYVASTFYRDLNFTVGYLQGNTPLGIGNMIFVISAVYAPSCGFVLNFGTTRFPKNNTRELRIKLRFTWGR